MKLYKVVIVEDDRIIRKSIVNSDWSSIQAEVVGEATDGEKGLEVIREAEPQLIVTDINMPFMDGITFAKKVREINPTIRIIFLTGYDNFEYVHEAVLLKTDDYLLKPINHEVLLEKAAVALSAWSEENQKQEKLSTPSSLLRKEFISRVIQNGANGVTTNVQEELLALGIFPSGPKYVVLNVRTQDCIEGVDLSALLSKWQVTTEIEVFPYKCDEAYILLSIDEQRLSWIEHFGADILETFTKKTNKTIYLSVSDIYVDLQDVEKGIIQLVNDR